MVRHIFPRVHRCVSVSYTHLDVYKRQEMESVESYLKLSQLGLSVPVNYNIAVDEKLEEFQILPLSVLTFVENEVKYSKCHPFYTGKQKLVDTGGRVDRFKKRFNMDK